MKKDLNATPSMAQARVIEQCYKLRDAQTLYWVQQAIRGLLDAHGIR